MSASISSLSSFKIVESVEVDISPGELIDKITILEIKMACIEDETKRSHIRHELHNLRHCRNKAIPESLPLRRLTIDLKTVNRKLWDIEDELRACERSQTFDDRFVTLARSVYKNNDRRAALKAQINKLMGATTIEEKSYVDYEDAE